MNLEKLALSIIILELIIVVKLIYSNFTISGKLTTLEISDIPKYSPRYLTESNNSKLYKELIPNFEQYYDGWVIKLDRVTYVKINSDGFRDRNFHIEKTNNTIRIAVIGDSFTFGVGLNLNETYPKLLEKKLNNLSDSNNYEVINFGVPGYSTRNEIEFLKLKALKYNPSIIIIGYFHNDMQNNSKIQERIDNEIYEVFGEHVNMSDFKTYKKIIEIHIKIQEEEDKFFRSSPFKEVWKETAEPLEELYNLTTEKNITVIITNVVPIRAYQSHGEKQLMALENITKKYGWYFLNLNNIFEKYEWKELTLSEHDSHLNPKGTNLVADELFNFLIEKNIISH